MNLLITGVSGFIGSNIALTLKSEFKITAPVRRNSNVKFENVDYPFETSLATLAENKELLSRHDVIVHAAAIAHVQGRKLDEYREVNSKQTIALARGAALAGVKRFVFLSSIGVNGSSTDATPFSIDDEPAPADNYAISKLEAEVELKRVAVETGIEVVIIRPPLVYGFSAPGNFRKLVKLSSVTFPLPLGAIHNKRSFVSIANLVDLIRVCLTHPRAANQTFLVSDDCDVSTTSLINLIAKANKRMPMLVPVPVWLLKFLASFVGKQAMIEKMTCNLQVDISHTKQSLGWSPPFSLEDGLADCFDLPSESC